MQYVGTLSWGMAAPTVEWGFGHSKTPATATAPGARRDGTRCAATLMGTATSEAAPATRATLAGHDGRAEVRALEQDWTQIVRRCMNGDSSAWAEMVRTHQKRVYGLCYRFTGNPTDAEDLTQDVFLKIYSNLGSFDAARGSLPVWITTMTRNLLVDNYQADAEPARDGLPGRGVGPDRRAEAASERRRPAGRRRAVAARVGGAERTEKDGAEGADESERRIARGSDLERFTRP